MPLARHRIIEQRGEYADSWLRLLDRLGGDVDAFIHNVAIENAHFYRPAPQPRGPLTIPRAAEIHERVIDGRRLSLALCRDPKLVLLEEIKN